MNLSSAVACMNQVSKKKYPQGWVRDTWVSILDYLFEIKMQQPWLNIYVGLGWGDLRGWFTHSYTQTHIA